MDPTSRSDNPEAGPRRAVALNFSWAVVNEAVNRGGSFIGSAYVARLLGADAFGVFILAQALAQYLFGFSDAGVSVYGIREISRGDRPKDSFREIASLRLAMSVVGFAVAAAAILSGWFAPEGATVYLAALVYLPAFALYNDWALKGAQRFDLLLWGSVVYVGAYLTALYALVEGPEDVATAALAWGGCFVIGAVPIGLCLRRLGFSLRPSFNLRGWLGELRHSAFFAAAGALSGLYQYAPLFAVGIVLSSDVAGQFGAAYRLVTIACAPGFFLATAFFPTLTGLYYGQIDQFWALRRVMIGIAAVAGLAVALAASIAPGFLMVTVFGAEFAPGAAVFAILVWLVPLNYVRYALSTSLRTTEYQRLQVLPVSAGLLLLVGGLLLARLQTGLTPQRIALVALVAEVGLIGAYLVTARLTYEKRAAGSSTAGDR